MQYPGIAPIQSGGGGSNQSSFSLSGGSPTSMDYPKGVECPDCGRHYKLKSSLRNHQKWECGKEPQFQCPYCNYRAKQKMHVARHIERMHREKLTLVESCMINNNSINNSNNNNNAAVWYLPASFAGPPKITFEGCSRLLYFGHASFSFSFTWLLRFGLNVEIFLISFSLLVEISFCLVGECFLKFVCNFFPSGT